MAQARSPNVVRMKRSALPLVPGVRGRVRMRRMPSIRRALRKSPAIWPGPLSVITPFNADALLPEPTQRPDEEAGGRSALPIGQNLDMGRPRRGIDGCVQEVVPPAVAGAAAVAGDAMADTSDRAGFLMSRWTGSPGRSRRSRRTGRFGSRADSRPSPGRVSQPATVDRARPRREAILSPVSRSLWPSLAVGRAQNPCCGDHQARGRARAVPKPGPAIGPPFADRAFADPRTRRPLRRQVVLPRSG